MSLPSKTDLQTLDVTWRGLPFCYVEATSLNTFSLDVTWRGLPFIAAEEAAVVTTSTIGIGDDDFDEYSARYERRRIAELIKQNQRLINLCAMIVASDMLH